MKTRIPNPPAETPNTESKTSETNENEAREVEVREVEDLKNSPFVFGFVLIAVGIFLMLLSGEPWENAAEAPPTEGSAVVSGAEVMEPRSSDRTSRAERRLAGKAATACDKNSREDRLVRLTPKVQTRFSLRLTKGGKRR